MNYSMGSRYKLKTKHVIPGPGDYECKSFDLTHSLKFGTSSRPSLENSYKSLIPGPSDYTGNFASFSKKAPKYGYLV